MPSPMFVASSRRRRRDLRQVAVDVPQEAPSTDAVFIVLRRMRTPLVILIAIFAVSVVGLMLIPGVDGQGRQYRLSAFDAFYFVSYTAMTIGFGETPYTFTIAQRMWVTVTIYASVIGWAYAFGTMFALAQDENFRSSLSSQRFRRRVNRIAEPFLLIAGYGHAGRMVGLTLDSLGSRFVVVDDRAARVEVLQTDELHSEVPAIAADARKPGVLGLAGLGHKHCAGVLALTDDCEANLSIVMAVHLLRPELPVIARCKSRVVAERMADFTPEAIINAYDRYGEYLVLALRRPVTFRLWSWLIAATGTTVPDERKGLRDGRWIVAANGHFGREIVRDLQAAGLEVIEMHPTDRMPDLDGVVGLVAGSEQDSTNLSIAAHARREDESMFLSVRQESHDTGPLVKAFDFDSVFLPTELVAQEVLARVSTPLYWSVLRHVRKQNDEWSQRVLNHIIERCGEQLAPSLLVTIDKQGAPAIDRWLAKGNRFTIDDLLRDPEDRERLLPGVPLMFIRGEQREYFPEGGTELQSGDGVVLMLSEAGFDPLNATEFYDETVEYVATGEQVPGTWLWRALRGAMRQGSS